MTSVKPMPEIGSEFWDVPVKSENNSIFQDGIQWYISGRSALKALLNGMENIKSVSMPSWCCDTMIRPFTDSGIKVDFYPVYFRDGLVQEISFGSDALLVMDYFGYGSEAPDLSEYDGTVIRDVTHSIFTEDRRDADCYFGSLRKWCGVWTEKKKKKNDGTEFLRGDLDLKYYSELRRDAMEKKEQYINGVLTDGRSSGKGYLEIFGKAEDYLETAGITQASERDVLLAGKLDVEFIKERRRANAGILMDAAKDMLIFPELRENDCPLFVPVLVPGGKRNELRKYLIDHEIYCPVHWPVSGLHRLGDREREIYDSELSLICDQRYTEEDMERIAETIKQFWREKL